MTVRGVSLLKYIVSPTKIISSMTDEQLSLAVFKKKLEMPVRPHKTHYSFASNLFRTTLGLKNNEIAEQEFRLALVTYERKYKDYKATIANLAHFKNSEARKNSVLLDCLGLDQTSSAELVQLKRDGYVSKAETEIFEMLRSHAKDEWRVLHQVKLFGLPHAIDIVVATSNSQVYAIEFDGPQHHSLRQSNSDIQRDHLLASSGINVIRVQYSVYAISCSQAVNEIMQILNGVFDTTIIVAPLSNDALEMATHRVEYDPFEDDNTGKFNSLRSTPKAASEPICAYIKPKRYCYIYCQTTGVSKDSQVVDFCMLLDEGATSKMYYTIVKPTCPIESGAAALHKISEQSVRNAPTLRKFLKENGLKPMLEDSGTLVVLYDTKFIQVVIQNTAPRYLNFTKMNKFSVVRMVRLKYGLPSNSTISDALTSLNILQNKYKRYCSKDYAKLVRELFLAGKAI